MDDENGKPWCAFGIKPGNEVPQDGNHWADCQSDCPGGQSDKIDDRSAVAGVSKVKGKMPKKFMLIAFSTNY